MGIYINDRYDPDVFFHMKKLSSYRSSSELAFADHFGILTFSLLRYRHRLMDGFICKPSYHDYCSMLKMVDFRLNSIMNIIKLCLIRDNPAILLNI